MPETFSWPPSGWILFILATGFLIALTAWLPLVLKRLPLSLPIVCVGLGALLFAAGGMPFSPLPQDNALFVEHFTELVVLIALMGAGLKLDRIFSWRRWEITWRLLGPTMLLSIAAVSLLGWWLLALSLPLAILLGACLAPTDPVLAADVQVGPPKSGEEDEVRFGLTSEAGLNDGLAFPFVTLAILLAAAAESGEAWVASWVLHGVLWEVLAAIAIGWLVGRLFGWVTFHIPAESKLAQTGDGVIAVAATLIAYGLCEVADSYGFLGVFVAALTIRASHRHHEFHREMHDFTEQVERIAMMVGLVLFGGALAAGLLAPLGWREIGLALLILLVVRPVAGLLGLWGFAAKREEKLTLAFFGIRGVGSFYYLAYGLNHMSVTGETGLWAVVGLVVLLSILLHGVTVTPIMRRLDHRSGRDPDTAGTEDAPADCDDAAQAAQAAGRA